MLLSLQHVSYVSSEVYVMLRQNCTVAQFSHSNEKQRAHEARTAETRWLGGLLAPVQRALTGPSDLLVF